MAFAVLLAQCTSEPCEIPRSLPWWMAGAILVVWLGAVMGVVVLARHRLALRAERRRSEQARRARREVDPSTPGRDIEPW
ncbi:MAG TPA: hypothetical protein VHN98_08980 [Acidimicrobiales bacterium]|nr:hypothetical protein [Acidimicrobiales bacterium]